MADLPPAPTLPVQPPATAPSSTSSTAAPPGAGTAVAQRSGLLRRLFAPPTRKPGDEDADDPMQDYGLWALRMVMFMGMIGVVFVSLLLGQGDSGLSGSLFWGNLGLGLLIAAAAGIVGGILGFLFGVPRSLQQDTHTMVVVADGSNGGTEAGGRNENGATSQAARIGRPAYDTNTNLEQISDWLTKIMVGVGLTQINTLQDRFDNMVYRLARGFVAGDAQSRLLFPYTAALVVFFAVGGFLMVYLWARIYLQRQLNAVAQLKSLKKQVEKTENVLAETKTQLGEKITALEVNTVQLEESKAMTRDTRINQLVYKIQQFGKQVNAIANAEEPYRDLVTRAAPASISVLNDSQKGRWGGEAERDGLRLTPYFTPHPTMKRTYTVTLTVEAVDGAAVLDTPVYFFLHETYSKDAVVKVQPRNGKATTTVESYEAFTVGAVCREGAVKLELDLNLHADCPDDYRYTCKIERIADLEAELKTLRDETMQQSA